MLRMRVMAVLLTVVVAIGCGGGGGNVTAPSTGTDVLATDAMADLAMLTGQMSEGSLDSEVTQMERQDQNSKEISETRSCPGGGEINIEGILTRTVNGNVTDVDGVGTRVQTDCVFERDEGTVTVNGTADWESHHHRVDGEPTGPQTTHWEGTSTFRFDDGSERTCRVDITITRNPTSERRILEGTICGRTVHRSGSWSPR